MPSKQTQNYKLSQWARTDKVLMDDFNADNAAIDAAVKAVDVKADALAQSKAEKSELDSLKQTVSAHTSSLNSHTSSLAKLGSCQIYTTSYLGDGQMARTLTFPAYPAFVHIRSMHTTAGLTFYRDVTAGDPNIYSAQWTNRELIITAPNTPNLEYSNRSGITYCVFALLDMSK